MVKRVSIFPKQLHGGPKSFMQNLTKGLNKLGIDVDNQIDPKADNPILLINGSRKVLHLIRCKWAGRRLIMRLGSPDKNLNSFDGLGLKDRVKVGLTRKLLVLLRRYLADEIIYQSNFVKRDWDDVEKIKKPQHIIYNGVDSDFYHASENIKRERIILSVEGTQGNDPFDIVYKIHDILLSRGVDFKIVMLGKAANAVEEKSKAYERINFVGEVNKSELKSYYQRSSAYLLTDYLSAGCPNALLESMASGCIPVAFKKGPVAEMYKNNVDGFLVKDDALIWQGESFTKYSDLASALEMALNPNSEMDQKLNQIVKENYSLDSITKAYLNILQPNS